MSDPAAWRVKDFADGWVLCRTEGEARRLAEGADNLVQPLYAIPPGPTAAEVEETTARLRLLAAAKTFHFDDIREAMRRAASLIERLAGMEVGRE